MRSGQVPSTESVELRGTTVPYTVRRHPRAKYMRITITPHNGVVVTLPARLPRYVSPAKFLQEHQEWVLEQIARTPIPAFRKPLAEGSVVHYLGKERRVRVQEGGLWQGCEAHEGEILVRVPLDFDGDLRPIILGWIRERAKEKIVAEAHEQAERIGVRFTQVTIRDQKTKWGSCSKNGRISFNWRLVLFPHRILRYVVIHELCHLRHFNHSPRFWALVALHDPHYEDAIRWLREHGPRIEGALR